MTKRITTVTRRWTGAQWEIIEVREHATMREARQYATPIQNDPYWLENQRHIEVDGVPLVEDSLTVA